MDKRYNLRTRQAKNQEDQEKTTRKRKYKQENTPSLKVSKSSEKKGGPEECITQVEAVDINGKEVQEEITCAICLDTVSSRAVLEPCLHEFDFVCIDEWTATHDTCPVCRQAASNIYYEIISDLEFKTKQVQKRESRVVAFRLSRTVIIIVPIALYEEYIWVWCSESASLFRESPNNEAMLDAQPLQLIENMNARSLYRLRNFSDAHFIRDVDGGSHQVKPMIVDVMSRHASGRNVDNLVVLDHF